MTVPHGRRRGRNRLGGEKSPYLLQHAENPVDWYPWGEEAFETARRLDRPLFLSIGYATCHWCHVMEHESFEDEEVARLMNDAFVSVKVDREERPDLDHFYMTVCQGLTGSGGWPLTVVMTPDRKPFFAGTYFPRESRFGRIGMVELIPRLKALWRQQREEVLRSAEEIAGAFRRSSPPPGEAAERPEPAGKTLQAAFGQISSNFDHRHGGFGRAPKFPHSEFLRLCLRYWSRTGSEEALRIVEKSLEAMRGGGVYDQVGFGYHRYSTDERWLLPHFEKMLYDQALISLAYVEAWQATGRPFYRRVAEEMFEYVMRDLQLPQGGFCCAEDADSEGVEGKFYLWSLEEVRQALGPERTDLMAGAFNLQAGGNFTDELGEASDRNILHRTGAPPGDLLPSGPLEEARKALLEARSQRVRPLRDDKVLVDWNGLMIGSLARGAAAFGSAELGQAAERGARFLLENLRDPGGVLLHRWREGDADLPAHLDDYAFFGWALIGLYQATFRPEYLRAAVDLTTQMLSRFWDDEGGGLFFTDRWQQDLPVRQKILEDGSLPSGNSVAAGNLLALARLTGDSGFEERAARLFGAAGEILREHPAAGCRLVMALDSAEGPSSEVVIVEGKDRPGGQQMLAALRERYLPDTVVHFLHGGRAPEELLLLAPFLAGCTPLEGRATAYVCRRQACAEPTNDVGRMLRLLQAPS